MKKMTSFTEWKIKFEIHGGSSLAYTQVAPPVNQMHITPPLYSFDQNNKHGVSMLTRKDQYFGVILDICFIFIWNNVL